MRWEESELRECSTGGGAATRLAPAVSFHLTGNKNGGTPALLLPDGKGRRRGGENPAGGARGDGGVVVGGISFHQHQDFHFKHLCI